MAFFFYVFSCFNGLEYGEVIETKNFPLFPVRKRSSLEKKQLALPSKKCRTNAWRVQDWPTKQICTEKVVCMYEYLVEITSNLFSRFQTLPGLFWDDRICRAKMCIFEFCRWKVGVDLTLSMWWFNSWPSYPRSLAVTNNPWVRATFSASQKGHHRRIARWTTFWCPWRFFVTFLRMVKRFFQRLLATSK